MAANKFLRTLSVFNRSTQAWAPIPVAQRPTLTSSNIHAPWTQPLSLVSWNIDAFSSRPVVRAKLILDQILNGPKSPDIIFLQEATPDVRGALLKDARVRTALLVTDAEDQIAFEGVPFSTLVLLSSARFASGPESRKEGDGIEGGGKFMLGCTSRITLPSDYKRDALCVEIIPPTASPATVFRLVNVHLDSLGHTLPFRARQIKLLADVLYESACSGVIIAGAFNAISPEAAQPIYKHNP